MLFCNPTVTSGEEETARSVKRWGNAQTVRGKINVEKKNGSGREDEHFMKIKKTVHPTVK